MNKENNLRVPLCKNQGLMNYQLNTVKSLQISNLFFDIIKLFKQMLNRNFGNLLKNQGVIGRKQSNLFKVLNNTKIGYMIYYLLYPKKI